MHVLSAWACRQDCLPACALISPPSDGNTSGGWPVCHVVCHGAYISCGDVCTMLGLHCMPLNKLGRTLYCCLSFLLCPLPLCVRMFSVGACMHVRFGRFADWLLYVSFQKPLASTYLLTPFTVLIHYVLWYPCLPHSTQYRCWKEEARVRNLLTGGDSFRSVHCRLLKWRLTS